MNSYQNSDSSKKIKIFFTIPNLGQGGAEKIMYYLLNHFSESCEISVVFNNSWHVYPIPTNCRIYMLDKDSNKGTDAVSVVFRNIKRVIRLRAILKREQPDICLSFLTNINMLIASLYPYKIIKRVIIAEHNNFSFFPRFYWKNLKRTKMLFAKYLYRKPDAIIAVSEGVKKDLSRTLKIQEDKIDVIYNPHDIKEIQGFAREEPQHPWLKEKECPVLVNAGRLIHQKGQDILLNAFKLVLEKTPARLIILGEGPLLKDLLKLSETLKIKDNVDFAGFQKNPYTFMSHCDVFVLPSRWEGFPNVMIEAMACGAAVVATRCQSGPEEVITDSVNGLLVPVEDEEKLSEAILKAIANPDLSASMGSAAKKTVLKFDVKTVMANYERVFNLTR